MDNPGTSSKHSKLRITIANSFQLTNYDPKYEHLSTKFGLFFFLSCHKVIFPFLLASLLSFVQIHCDLFLNCNCYCLLLHLSVNKELGNTHKEDL